MDEMVYVVGFCILIGVGACAVSSIGGKSLKDHQWHQCVSICDTSSVHDVKDGFCLCSGEWRRNLESR